MVDYLISGITEDSNFTLYTGTTPYTGVLYGHYSAGTSSVTITDVPNNYKFYAIFENDLTGFKTYKLIKTSSAYCDTGVCDAVFTLSVTNVPTPTISVTPTYTPTPSITPSNTPTPSITPSNRILVTPTPTNSLTPTRTPTNTPTNTVTPSTSPVSNCGYYTITFSNPDPATSQFSVQVNYVDCSNISQSVYIPNNTTYYTCIREINGVPQLSVSDGYDLYVGIFRQSNCDTIT